MENKIKIIAAVDKNYGFGKDGKIPWHFPEDLKYFKSMTAGGVCIFGRKTYEDMGSYFKKGFLPGRTPVLVSSSNEVQHENVIVTDSLQHAIDYGLSFNSDIALIGGQRIFEEGLEFTTDVYLTRIDKDYECDVFFPREKLQEKFRPYHIRSSETEVGMSYWHYIRNNNET